MRLVDNLVRFLETKMGVKTFFGVGGANIEDFYDAIAISGKSRAFIAKHEFSAACMADGHARVSGKIGVVLTTSGGGALNLVPALGESFTSRVPVLAFVGQPPLSQEGKGAFQDSSGKAGTLCTERVFSEVSKICLKIRSVDELIEVLPKAIQIAMTYPRGPVVFLLPKDVQVTHVNSTQERLFDGLEIADFEPLPERNLKRNTIHEVIDSLMQIGPKKNLFILGEEVVRSLNSISIVQDVAHFLDAKVAVTVEGRASFSKHHSLYAGVTGVMGHQEVANALQESDVCIVLGTRLSVMDRYGLESLLDQKRVIHVNWEEPFFLGLSGEFYSYSPWRFLEIFLERVQQVNNPLKSNRNYFNKEKNIKKPFEDGSLSLGTLAEDLESLMNRSGTNLFIDAGNVASAVASRIEPPHGGKMVMALGMGGMGYSFGAAIGACLATGSPSIVLAGDGAFYMHGMEIHTAVDQELPILFVIANNQAHGMCVTREQVYLDAKYSFNQFKPTNIAAGLQAMFSQIPVWTVQTRVELKAAASALQDLKQTAVLVLELSNSELPPFMPFLNELKKKGKQLCT